MEDRMTVTGACFSSLRYLAKGLVGMSRLSERAETSSVLVSFHRLPVKSAMTFVKGQLQKSNSDNLIGVVSVNGGFSLRSRRCHAAVAPKEASEGKVNGFPRGRPKAGSTVCLSFRDGPTKRLGQQAALSTEMIGGSDKVNLINIH